MKRDIDTLLELFPFMFGYKELDRAMSYIEGQLRLQLLVSECRQAECLFKPFKTYVRIMIRHLNHIQLSWLMRRVLEFQLRRYELY